ncbi:MAG: hypothetical protein JW715_14795 [Sedimentisphaerales bacterium]|nr:hypothetical protein [Sedimentisphaerales bacterium]
MRFVIFCSLIGLICFFGSGCAVGPILHVQADDINSKETAEVRLLRSDGRTNLSENLLHDYINPDVVHNSSTQIPEHKICRIKYHEQYYKNRYMVVEGRIGLQGRRYPVVLDTGASQPIFLNVTHVLDNKIPIYSMEGAVSELNGHRLGLCYLPLLEIGEIVFTNRPCFYLEPPETLSLFGIQIASRNPNSDTVILGLPVLREFNYVMFDNIDNEVEFSYNETFKVSDESLWERYPLSIEEDFHGNVFLFVWISIADENIELQFDTGSGRGLAVGEKLWQQISSEIKELALKKGKDFYPYIGRLECKRGIIERFKVGDRVIKNAEISIFPDDSPLLDECDGLLGMQYFRDTEVILDFERSLLWVKKQDL